MVLESKVVQQLLLLPLPYSQLVSSGIPIVVTFQAQGGPGDATAFLRAEGE